jgi:rare lipoprotein A
MDVILQRILLGATCVAMLVGCDTRDEAAPPAVGEPGASAAPAAPPSDPPGAGTAGTGETGTATVYAGMLEGGTTASGEAFSHDELVAAHRTHTFGSQVRVTNVENNRSVNVRIIDRTPSGTDAVIDLSRAAAEQLGIGPQGQAQVRVEPAQ